MSRRIALLGSQLRHEGIDALLQPLTFLDQGFLGPLSLQTALLTRLTLQLQTVQLTQETLVFFAPLCTLLPLQPLQFHSGFVDPELEIAGLGLLVLQCSVLLGGVTL